MEEEMREEEIRRLGNELRQQELRLLGLKNPKFRRALTREAFLNFCAANYTDAQGVSLAEALALAIGEMAEELELRRKAELDRLLREPPKII